ncbi:hypothetical protein [Inconstantimicrobium porci]|uniref:Uncharacterized protein n=1 Tax=Inconstantimicrobium porci TaxID=2652291 RepID=A0A7X2N055_9CLOT|nr:hypothetical protein [Inconstantimicrobium porci]MDD6772273.1 hypothetical protein [Inconstantimicrobium porci]MSR92331.1 hypothetical protein [Inconstantimicrobium porci]
MAYYKSIIINFVGGHVLKFSNQSVANNTISNIQYENLKSWLDSGGEVHKVSTMNGDDFVLYKRNICFSQIIEKN